MRRVELRHQAVVVVVGQLQHTGHGPTLGVVDLSQAVAEFQCVNVDQWVFVLRQSHEGGGCIGPGVQQRCAIVELPGIVAEVGGDASGVDVFWTQIGAHAWAGQDECRPWPVVRRRWSHTALAQAAE